MRCLSLAEGRRRASGRPVAGSRELFLVAAVQMSAGTPIGRAGCQTWAVLGPANLTARHFVGRQLEKKKLISVSLYGRSGLASKVGHNIRNGNFLAKFSPLVCMCVCS